MFNYLAMTISPYVAVWLQERSAPRASLLAR
jgi:hypothetical protein